jgi:hypothetical protein
VRPDLNAQQRGLHRAFICAVRLVLSARQRVAFAVRPIESARQRKWHTAMAMFLVVQLCVVRTSVYLMYKWRPVRADCVYVRLRPGQSLLLSVVCGSL